MVSVWFRVGLGDDISCSFVSCTYSLYYWVCFASNCCLPVEQDSMPLCLLFFCTDSSDSTWPCSFSSATRKTTALLWGLVGVDLVGGFAMFSLLPKARSLYLECWQEASIPVCHSFLSRLCSGEDLKGCPAFEAYKYMWCKVPSEQVTHWLLYFTQSILLVSSSSAKTKATDSFV